MFPVILSILMTPQQQPLPPLPSDRQLAWHKLERVAFIHFGPNTFTGEEWGKGSEDPKIFNPEKLDCRQWVSALKAGGLKGVIITAKHHDGFCLWPSKFSKHTVAKSPWKGGKGDVLKELSEACKEAGLKFGVYVSPWDRNHPSYGTPEYNQIFAKMLEEVLTQYGPIFEVWFDGANGEGPNGKKQVYDWPLFINTVRKHQPDAVMFSDAGPDVRWIGNEAGQGADVNWANLNRDRYMPGTPLYEELAEGQREGSHWVPAEAPVSIRPGWFWKESENSKVKSTEQLLDIYFNTVGLGATLNLNVPPNSDGLISTVDAERLKDWQGAIEKDFAHEIKIERAQWDQATLWAEFGSAQTIDKIVVSEQVSLGQRVAKFEVEVMKDGSWVKVATAGTIGVRRFVRFAPVQASAVRVRILDSRGEALQPTLKVYRAG
jgi:alpha-L-fucosidase